MYHAITICGKSKFYFYSFLWYNTTMKYEISYQVFAGPSAKESKWVSRILGATNLTIAEAIADKLVTTSALQARNVRIEAVAGTKKRR